MPVSVSRKFLAYKDLPLQGVFYGFVLPANLTGKTKPPSGGASIRPFAVEASIVSYERRRRDAATATAAGLAAVVLASVRGRGQRRCNQAWILFTRWRTRRVLQGRDARWRFCLEDDRVSLPRHPPSRPPDLPPSRPPVRLIYRLCRARSKRSSVASASRPPSSLSLGAGSSAIDHGRGARRRRRARPPSFAALSPSLPPVTALFLAHTI